MEIDMIQPVLEASSTVILAVILIRLIVSAERIGLRVIDRLANCDCRDGDNTQPVKGA